MNTNHELDRILGALNETQPRAHMEQRLKARLAARPVAARRWSWNPAWFALPAACAVLIALFIAHHPATTTTIATETVPTLPATTQSTAIAPTARPARATRHTVNRPTTAPHTIDDAYLPSIPTPALPLTKEEHQLRLMASPHSPTMLAQVEPMREMQLREQTETARRRSYDRFAEAMLAPLAAGDKLQQRDTAPVPEPDTKPSTEIQ